MALEKYTKPSSDSYEMHDAASADPELVFPDAEGFRSVPPRVSLAEVIQRSRQLRQWFPSGLPSAEERWRAKSTVEFRL